MNAQVISSCNELFLPQRACYGFSGSHGYWTGYEGGRVGEQCRVELTLPVRKQSRTFTLKQASKSLDVGVEDFSVAGLNGTVLK